MNKFYLTPCRLMMAIILLVTPISALFAQWEPTGKLERKEKAIDPHADPDIIIAKPTRIAADNSGTVAITVQKEIWKNAGTVWTRLEIPRFPFGIYDEFAFEDVAAYNGITYVVSGNGKIYKVEEKKDWVEMTGDERAKRIAADNNGQLWIIDKNYAVKYFDSNNNVWTVYPGNAKANDIAAYNGTPVIVAQPSGNIMYGTGARWERLGPLEWSCSDVSIDPTNGMVWMTTGTKYSIWAYTASGWREYPGGGTAFDICGYNKSPYLLNRSSAVMMGKSSDAIFSSAGEIPNGVTPAPTQMTAAVEVTPVVTSTVSVSTTDPYIRIAKSTYKTFENIEVEFGNFEGSVFDWITLIEKDKPDGEFGTFKYTGGGANGKVAFTYGWTGTYELRGFFNNGKEVKARVTIKID